MPWTVENPPDVAKNWTKEEIERCVAAANAVLEEGGTDDEAIYACIAAAGKSKDRAMNDQRELRVMPVQFEVRESDGESPKIVGYPAKFNAWSEDLGGFIERIAPGAFTETIAQDDVRALFNHNPDYVLGRNRAGTLSLTEDDIGLRMEITPPETQWARDLLVSIRRNDVNQGSFGFRINDWEKDQVWEEPPAQAPVDTPWRRTLLKVRLFDVSLVTFPAYPQTEAHLRGLGFNVYTPAPPQKRDAGNSIGEGGQEAPSHPERRRKLYQVQLDMWR